MKVNAKENFALEEEVVTPINMNVQTLAIDGDLEAFLRGDLE